VLTLLASNIKTFEEGSWPFESSARTSCRSGKRATGGFDIACHCTNQSPTRLLYVLVQSSTGLYFSTTFKRSTRKLRLRENPVQEINSYSQLHRTSYQQKLAHKTSRPGLSLQIQFLVKTGIALGHPKEYNN
jgi:hypothetical protein